MEIIKVEKKKEGRYTKWFFTFDDGSCLDAVDAGSRIGIGQGALISRHKMFGLSHMLTYEGTIPRAVARKYELKRTVKKVNVSDTITKGTFKEDLFLRNGEKIPANGKFDYLIKCKEAPTDDYNHYEASDTEGFKLKRDVGLMKAYKKLVKFNKKMIKKGFLEESGTLVNPGFGEQKNGIWI